VSGILHFVNGTAIDWYSKKQATVETATYGSEFVAARIAVEQIESLRLTLRYLGVPIEGRSFMFGDNQSVVTSSTVPHSPLKKRHNALSYHRVREAMASDMLNFLHLPGEENPADILSKHWGYQQVWDLLRPVLFPPWSTDNSAPDKPEGSIMDPAITVGTDGEQTRDTRARPGSSARDAHARPGDTETEA